MRGSLAGHWFAILDYCAFQASPWRSSPLKRHDVYNSSFLHVRLKLLVLWLVHSESVPKCTVVCIMMQTAGSIASQCFRWIIPVQPVQVRPDYCLQQPVGGCCYARNVHSLADCRLRLCIFPFRVSLNGPRSGPTVTRTTHTELAQSSTSNAPTELDGRLRARLLAYAT